MSLPDHLVPGATYVNDAGDQVVLLEETAVNRHGSRLLWVECVNGAKRSVWERDFLESFCLASFPDPVSGGA